MAISPSTVPAAKKASSSATSGVCSARSKKKRSVTGSTFLAANATSRRNTSTRIVHVTTRMPASYLTGWEARSCDAEGALAWAESTRSRSSLPALKCGTYFSGTCTFSPDLGLRPVRGGR